MTGASSVRRCRWSLGLVHLAVLAVVVIAWFGSAVDAQASAVRPLAHIGPWVVDAHGRVVVLHGVNMVDKQAPWFPAAAGFGADDARFLAENGFNVVRLGFAWSQVEPEPGHYDEAYIAHIKATERLLARFGIYSLVDSHQDLFTTKVSGDWNGFPAWAAIDDGLPVQPASGFPLTYFTGPAENAAWTNFWNDHPAPDGVGLQEHYAAMWQRVAAAFADQPYVLGYDVINEPWPGWTYPTCAPPAGCPVFEQGPLASGEGKAMRAIRAVDPAHLLFYEPAVTNLGGGQVWVPNPSRDPRAGMSFHVYCLTPGVACGQLEQLELDNALRRADANGDPGLVSEWGASSDPTTLAPQADMFDHRMTSWIFWSYNENVVHDMRRPPTGANLDSAVLAALERPYPQLVAGTPQAFSYDRATDTFTLRYTTERADGRKRFPAGSVSEIFVPPLHYAHGYIVNVQGATVRSPAGSRVLRLASRAGAREVHLVIRPSGSHSARG